MKQNAKLYYLKYRDFSQIKETIEFDPNGIILSEKIVVYNHTVDPLHNCYLIISIDKKINKIIEENGGTEAPQKDVYKIRVKERKNQGNLIFGNEELIDFL